MFNLDDIANENNEDDNTKWPCILDHPYRMLIIELNWFWIVKN